MADETTTSAVSEDRLKARVYLRSVLPLLETVTVDVEKYKNMIAKWDCAIQFEVLGDEEAATHLLIKGGTLKCIQGRHENPAIRLGFKTLAALNTTLGGGMAPIKIKGLTHPVLLVKTLLLLNSLKMLMPTFEAKTVELKMLKVKLLLYMVTSAMGVMCGGGDEFMRRLVRGNKGKIIQWLVPDGPEAYVELADTQVHAHIGKFTGRPYLQMKFRDLDAAYDVFTGKLDAVQATAQQAMALRGPSEYGMRVGNMMKRVDNFMMGGS